MKTWCGFKTLVLRTCVGIIILEHGYELFKQDPVSIAQVYTCFQMPIRLA